MFAGAYRRATALLLAIGLGASAGCGGSGNGLRRPVPELSSVKAVTSNKGRYLSPFTVDGTLSKWVDKGLNIKAGELSGAALGGVLGKIVSPNSPLGAVFAASVGSAVGREIAIETFGGWDYIRETSNLSFDYLDEMAIYLYREFKDRPTYKDGMKAAFLVYPRLREVYPLAVRAAVLASSPASSE